MKLTPDEIKKLQTFLHEIGLYDGAIDGVVGPKTIGAFFALGVELTNR